MSAEKAAEETEDRKRSAPPVNSQIIQNAEQIKRTKRERESFFFRRYLLVLGQKRGGEENHGNGAAPPQTPPPRSGPTLTPVAQ